MTHPSQLEFLMYVDGALSAAQNTALQSHFGSCDQCRESLSALRGETELFNAALAIEQPKTVPAFHQPASLKGLSIAIALTALVASLSTLFWLSLYSVWFSRAFAWFGSIHIGDAISATVNTVFYFSEKGIPMIDVLLNILAIGMLASVAAYFMSSKRELRGTVSLCFSILIMSTFLSSPTAQALDIRAGEASFTIEADETIDDTVIIAGEAAIVEGVINGDLIVFGQRVVVNGTVTGNLIAFTQSATISGRVEGSVLGFAQFIDINSASIQDNLWSFSNKLTINEGSSIEGNATMFGNAASVAGNIAKDLTGFGQNIELSGTVGDDVETFTQSINLLGEAYVGGNIRYRANSEDALQQSSNAVVIGNIEHVLSPNFERNELRPSVGGKILGQVIRLLMAFVAGMVLLWFFPILQSSTIKSGLEGLKSAGIGLISLICVPIIAVICAITVIGLPFALIGLFAWLVALFFAKIVVASIIGRLIITSPEKQNHYALTLFVGLVIVIALVNIPWVGGVLGVVMTIIGVGILMQYFLAYLVGLENSEH